MRQEAEILNAQCWSQALQRASNERPVLRLGLAVSGGSDSLAMLYLAADWAQQRGVQIQVATVDHGLRTAAKDEAAFVADVAGKLGLTHEILTWHEPPSGNLQNAARQARYDLLASWGRRHELDAIAIAHTADDQAETFLMRLARGSGVDGLSSMRRDWLDRGQRWLRPLLDCSRQSLRDELTAQGRIWVDDPSNEDARFDRVKVRGLMASLGDIGVTPARLVQTAAQMSRVQDVLTRVTETALQSIARVEFGEILLECDGFCALDTEIRHRLLAGAVKYLGRMAYRPRYKALQALEHDVLLGKKRSLSGCIVFRRQGQIRICREFQAVREIPCLGPQAWDQYWQLDASDTCDIRALGEDLLTCPSWRELGISREAALVLPAVFQGDRLIFAPFGLFGENFKVIHAPNLANFRISVLSH